MESEILLCDWLSSKYTELQAVEVATFDFILACWFNLLMSMYTPDWCGVYWRTLFPPSESIKLKYVSLYCWHKNKPEYNTPVRWLDVERVEAKCFFILVYSDFSFRFSVDNNFQNMFSLLLNEDIRLSINSFIFSLQWLVSW